ncbi:MAG: hypothetical protein JSU68_02885 [Phycisphaerales bacterium]|nr:MAG: hypothetical protein JSU68_02885 [Phycisphaerales bacterium]
MAPWFRYAAPSLQLALAATLLTGGCKDPSIVGKAVFPVDLKPVEAFGRVLDEQAPPQDVVYVLLQAIRQDVAAARARDREAELDAMKLETSLAAPESMLAAYRRVLERGALPVETTAEIAVHKLVRMWAPMLAHYQEAFDTDYDAALANMAVHRQPNSIDAVVLYDVPSDTGEPPATIKAEMRREKDLWRIRRLSFSDDSAAEVRARTSQSTPAALTPPSTGT